LCRRQYIPQTVFFLVNVSKPTLLSNQCLYYRPWMSSNTFFLVSWSMCALLGQSLLVQYPVHFLISARVTHPSWPLQCVTPATVTFHGSFSLSQHVAWTTKASRSFNTFSSPIRVPVMALLLLAVHERTLAPACIPFVPTEPRSEIF
jgi:hypothetical protein